LLARHRTHSTRNTLFYIHGFIFITAIEDMGFVLQCKVQLVATRFRGKHIAFILSVTGFPLCRAKKMWRTGWINFKSERKINHGYRWRHNI